MTSELDALCPELSLLIIECLDDRAVKNLRLVSKRFRKLSMKQFGVRFYTHLLVFHHKCSVATFLEIASHETLCLFVDKITVNAYGVQMDAHNQQIDCSEWKSNFQTALQRFPNLKAIEFDNHYKNPPTTLQCGRKNMDIDLSKKRCHCVFPAALNALVDFEGLTEIHLKISTETILRDGDEFCLWVNSTSWTDHFASKVTELQLICNEKNSNRYRVLQLHQSVHMLEAFQYVGNVPDDTFTKVYWPRLDTISLVLSAISEVSLLRLLETHKATLKHVILDRVELSSGSWFRPLRSIFKMEQLCLVELLYLDQPDGAYNSYELSVDKLDAQHPVRVLVMDNKQIIENTAPFLQYGLWTAFGYGHSEASYTVDFRVLKAQLANKITVCREGSGLVVYLVKRERQPS
jgi:hypothetical protein